LLEILATFSFSPSAQKQKAGGDDAFFFPKRKYLVNKNIIFSVALVFISVSYILKKYKFHGPFYPKKKIEKKLIIK